jgi:hypothetical protein
MTEGAMTLNALAREDSRRSPTRSIRKNGLLQLGSPHFLLLVGVLGGILALVALVFIVQLSSL